MYSQARFGVFVSIGLLLALTGCAGDGSQATVTGKVTYKNAPVVGLTIRFESANGSSSSASLDAEGNYKMTDAPVGNVQVSFLAPPGKMGMPGAGGAGGTSAPPAPPKDVKPIEETGPTVKPTNLPVAYLNKDSAKLNYEVKKGKNTINIELK